MIGTPREREDGRPGNGDPEVHGPWNEPLFALLKEIQDYGPSEIAVIVARRIVALKPVQVAGVWLAKSDVPELTLSGWAAAEGQHFTDAERERIGRLVRTFPVGADADQYRMPSEQDAEDTATVARFPLHHRSGLLGLLVTRCRRSLSREEFTGLQLLAHALGAQLSEQQRLAETTSEQSDSNPPTAARFTALVTHELRTPLTGLRGNVQLAGMALRKGDTARAEARLQAVIQAVDGITVFVQNLQDISHLERGIFQIAVTPSDLGKSVQSAVKRASRLSASERHSIEFEQPAAVVTVHDPVRVEHAVYNLLANAIQYSIDGGIIHVRIESGDDSVHVIVSDPGIGISPDDQEHIFEPYFRGEDARKVSAKGLGLGLTICRATVERHGGSVNVERSDRSGTTIVAQLPRHAESLAGSI